MCDSKVYRQYRFFRRRESRLLKIEKATKETRKPPLKALEVMLMNIHGIDTREQFARMAYDA